MVRHLQTFYRSRCQVTTQRQFNDLNMNFQEIYKSSDQAEKILAESNWFNSIPSYLRMFTPALLGHGQFSRPWYSLEYLPIPSLHDMFIFGELEDRSWRQILNACFIFMQSCLKSNSNNMVIASTAPLRDLVCNKTSTRLDEFLDKNQIHPSLKWSYQGIPLLSLHQIAQNTADAINYDDPSFLGVMHGDLCFTDIFYDFRTQKIQVIDPRGTLDDDMPTIFGDIRDDMAKLSHSVFGGYDFILANRYSCKGYEDRNLSIEFNDDGKMLALGEIFKTLNINGLSFNTLEMKALTIHLFLAMLPLHSDRPDRQKAFLANALRLYSESFI